MKNKNFWFWSLVALIMANNAFDFGMWGRIALIANAMVVLLDVAVNLTDLIKQRRRNR